jgi:hypothetical protein
MSRDRALWEIRNEKNKANVRWVLVGAVTIYLSCLLWRGEAPARSGREFFNAAYIFGVLTAATAFNLALTLYLVKAMAREIISPAVKYASMTGDFLLVALVLVPTGGSESLLYPLNYVIIVSNALRYGMAMALAGTLIMNLFYLGVLAAQYWPQTQIPDFHQEMLKVAAFWLVGIYTGYLSRRYEILRGEVERYEKLLREALKENG